jgi:toxin ParE1/3/4
MKQLVFTPAARDDLLTIGLYIADDDPVRAESFVAELEAKARQIVEWPGSFPARDDISPGLRAAIHGQYLLLFRDLGEEVRLVRILHGARNLQQIFDAGA